MIGRALVSCVGLAGVLCATSLLASAPPKPTAQSKEPVKARTDVAMTVTRVQGTVAWPKSGGTPTEASATAACALVQVAAGKQTPSGGMMPKTETLGETTASPVDANDRAKGCTYALVGLPTAQAMQLSARFTGAWSSPLGGGGVWSTAATMTLKPGTVTKNFELVVNAVK